MGDWDKWLKHAQEKFKNHKATLIQDTDRYVAIDWRNENGSGDYYVNFIVDKKRGSFIVSGDLGDSIATWYNPITLSNLKSYIYHDTEYYIGKFQCTSDKYFYDADFVFECLVDWLEMDCITEYIEVSGDFEDYQEFEEELKDQICDSIRGDEFVPTEKLYDMVTNIYSDGWEYLYNCGAQIKGRVYLWAIGFNMACEQLGF